MHLSEQNIQMKLKPIFCDILDKLKAEILTKSLKVEISRLMDHIAEALLHYREVIDAKMSQS